MKKICITLFIMFWLASSAYAIDDLYMGGFEGTWTGTLQWISPNAHEQSKFLTANWLSDHESMQIKLIVHKKSANVFLKYKGEWREIMPGKFTIESHKTNAVVYAFNSSDDIKDMSGKGGWVETWSFTLTHKDKNRLFAYQIKSVNNYLSPYDRKDSNGTIIGRYFRSSFGELEKKE